MMAFWLISPPPVLLPMCLLTRGFVSNTYTLPPNDLWHRSVLKSCLILSIHLIFFLIHLANICCLWRWKIQWNFWSLSFSARALLILDLPVSLASFLPHVLGCSNTELLLHVHAVISLCIALPIPFDLNLLPVSFIHFLLASLGWPFHLVHIVYI